MTKVYMLNPNECIEQLKAADVRTLAWNIGSYKRRNIDPIAYLRMHLGVSRPWELMVVAVEGASIYTEQSANLDCPVAVYPVWNYEQGFDALYDYINEPVGEDHQACNSKFTPRQFRPKFGQDHAIVIDGLPDMTTAVGRNFYLQLSKIMIDNSSVRFIAHNVRAFRFAFGGTFESVTMSPWSNGAAIMNNLLLPNGRKEMLSDIRKHVPWIKMLGFSVNRIKTREDVCAYNIEAIRWASDNYLNMIDFRLRANGEIPDTETPASTYGAQAARTNLLATARRVAFKPGDGLLCDACSLALNCKFYREGAVCGLPKTDGEMLSKMFGSRDADTILDGLSKIAEIQAYRVGQDLESEAATGERTPDTDKRLKDLFESGVKIAKLRKPELNGKGVQVNVGMIGAGAAVIQSTPQELIAGAVKTLESHGIPRDKITDDSIIGLLEAVHHRDGAAKIEEIIDAELEE